jgi:hypothetical protein
VNKRNPFQYSILRYHHDVTTGEFINVGLALYSESSRYFRVQLVSKYRRITQTFPGADGELFRKYIENVQNSFNKIAEDIVNEQLELFGNRYPENIEDLLSGVLPKDDSAIRFSESKGGATYDFDIEFDQLFYSLIEKYLTEIDTRSRDDNEIWNVIRPQLKNENILHRLSKHIVSTEVEVFEFEHAYKNGHWNVIDPLSLDLVHAGSIRKKAKERLGGAIILDKYSDLSHLYYLLGRPLNGDRLVLKAFDDARRILKHDFKRLKVELIEEDEIEDFAKVVKRELGE